MADELDQLREDQRANQERIAELEAQFADGKINLSKLELLSA